MSDTQLANIDDVKTIAVLGAGTMGHGIAQVAAQAGFTVVMRDIEQSFVDRGLERIQANLDKGVAKSKVEPADRDAALERVSGSTDLAAAVANADVVIEAVPEKMDLKHEIFKAVDEAAPARAVLATNTSSLSIAKIAECLANPARMVGMHFFNPVHIMKLVEVIKHERTDEVALACALGLVERFRKTGITVNDAPGFASSRLGLVLGLEAMRMVEQGVASAADIDTAMRLGYGHPMGPLELTDLVGLDVRMAIADYLSETVGEHFRAPDILRAKVADGKVGKKSGEGFYVWKDGKKQ